MASLIFNNNATTTLSGSINNTQTSISVTSSGLFPVISGGDYFYATMYEISGSTEINVEIIKVTAVSGTTWTIERGLDGTTARARSGVTVYIELRWTAASARLMLQKDNNLSDLTNAATARTNLGLGTMATQSASNVAITGGTISGVSFTTIDSTTTIADNIDPTKKVAFEVSGVTTGTTRTLTIPNNSGTIALISDLTAGYQPLDAELTAIAAIAANGLIVRTAAGAAAVRTIAVPASGLTITNPDGVSGNPTLALADDLAAVEALATTGFVRRTGTSAWSASALVDGDLPTALTGKTYNALNLTANATGFSVAGGTTAKTLTVQNSLTLAGTDGTTITMPSTSGTLALAGQTFYIGTTAVAINRASGALALTGVSIDGSAGSATSATSATTATNLAGGLANQISYQTGAGATGFIAAPSVASTYLQWTGTGFAWAAATSGSVTSVAVSSSDLTVTGSPITSSGTISLTLNTVPLTKGGTGATTKTAAFNALTPMTTVGDIEYHDGTNGTRLAGNTTTTKKFLRSTGNGTVATAPAWDTLVDGDLPSALTGKTYNALSLTAAATGFIIAGGTTSKTLTVSNTLTLAGTDSSTLNIGAGGTLGSAAFTASTAYAPAAGSTSIATLGTVTAGTWQASTIGITYGGTGATTKTAAFNALSPMTTLGDLEYHDGTNGVRLAGNTAAAKRFLTQTGNGTVSAAPGWNSIVDGDLPSALTGKTYNGLSLTANATGFQIAGGTTAKTLVVSNNLTLAGTDGSTLNIGGGGTLGSAAYTNSSDYLTAASASSTYAPLANPAFTGNVGLGAPILSGSAGHAFVPATGVLSSAGTSVNVTNNARYTSGWVANSTGTAGMYSITGRAHQWYGAASVAAGAALSMISLMNLDASGNLSITGTFSGASLTDLSVSSSKLLDLSISTAKLADGAVTPAKLSQPFARLSVVDASLNGNTSIDFTGIPSWAKRITICFDSLGTSGTSKLRIKTGSSIGFSAYSYFSASSSASSSLSTITSSGNAGFDINSQSNTFASTSGVITLVNRGNNNGWICSGQMYSYGDSATISIAGSVVMGSEVLDRIRVTTVSGADTIDIGLITVLYE